MMERMGKKGEPVLWRVAKTIDVYYSNLWRKHFSRVARGKPALKQLRTECHK